MVLSVVGFVVGILGGWLGLFVVAVGLASVVIVEVVVGTGGGSGAFFQSSSSSSIVSHRLFLVVVFLVVVVMSGVVVFAVGASWLFAMLLLVEASFSLMLLLPIGTQRPFLFFVIDVVIATAFFAIVLESPALVVCARIVAW